MARARYRDRAMARVISRARAITELELGGEE